MDWEKERIELERYSKFHERDLEAEHLREKLRREYFQCITSDPTNKFEEALKKIANLIMEAYFLGYIDGQDNKPMDLVLGNVYARKFCQK